MRLLAFTKKLYKAPPFFLLFALFCLAFLLRFLYLPTNLFFGPEQGIDLLVIKDIVIHHNPTLIGPKTDISGIFHGPIYYYLATIPFFLSSGNPLVISAFFVLFNCLTIFSLYFLGKEFFNKEIALLAAFFFTLNYELIIAARWLSSQPLAIPVVCLYFYLVSRFLREKEGKYLLAAVMCFGFLSQTQFLNLLLFSAISLTILVIYFKTFFKIRKIYLFLSGLLFIFLPTANFILFDLRHERLILNSIIALFSHDNGYYLSSQKIVQMIDEVFVQHIITNTLIPQLPILSAMLLGVGSAVLLRNIFTIRNTSFLLLGIWLFIPFLVLIVLRHVILTHYFLPLLPGIILYTAFILYTIYRKNKQLGLLLILLFVLLHSGAYRTYIPNNTNIFFQASAQQLKYSDQLTVVDWIHKNAKQPFTYAAYTIPYNILQQWEYLFWYSKIQPIPSAQKKLLLIQEDKDNQNLQTFWRKEETKSWEKTKIKATFGILTIEEYKKSNEQ